MTSRNAYRSLTAATLLCAAGSLGLAQCAPTIRIGTPAVDAALTNMPVTVSLDYTSMAEPGSLVVRLDGVDVSDQFTVEPPAGGRVEAYADFLWSQALLVPGPHLLEASVEVASAIHGVSRPFTTEGDPYVDAVDSYTLGTDGGFNEAFLPSVVLGPPAGGGLFGGTLDVFSLGFEGEIVLAFSDNVVVDGPGVDLLVFENAFLVENPAFQVIESLFSEPGSVSVSQDGIQWFPFGCANQLADAPYYLGCAGVYPTLANGEPDDRHPSVPTLTPPITSFVGQLKSAIVLPDGAGGDGFDLDDVGLGWARYVRIVAADHVNGGGAGPSNAGFDLDAVAAVNSAPATDANANGIPDAVE